MISSTVWVQRGAMQPKPARHEVGPEELEMMRRLASAEQGKSASSSAKLSAASPLEREFRLDEYDDDENGLGDGVADMDLATVLTASGVGVSVDGEEGEGDHEESDASDAEDDVIKPSDAVLLVAHTEEEYSCVEVQVYDEENGSLYVHHDIALPAFPLALAWIPGQPSAEATDGPSGSFVAVGTFKPGIEIWNLDVLDPLEPTAVLGGEQPGAQPSKPRGKARGRGAASSAPLVDGSHTDAVMALAWNGVRAGYACLASASADTTVKLWDVAAQRCVDTLRVHDGKVQDLCWHPQHASLLASGSFDRTAAIVDTRSAAAGGPCAKCSTTADVESICWNPFATEQLLVASEDGVVSCHDVRSLASPLWTLRAHDKPASSVCFSPHVPGLMVTASVDKSVKVWDVLDAAPAPTLVATKAMAVGQLFSAQFDVGAPFLLAVGGSKGVVALWEMNEDRSISSAFSGRDALASQLQHTKPAFSFEPPPSAAAPPPAGPPAASSVGPAGDAPAPAGPGSAKAKKKSKSRRGGK